MSSPMHILQDVANTGHVKDRYWGLNRTQAKPCNLDLWFQTPPWKKWPSTTSSALPHSPTRCGTNISAKPPFMSASCSTMTGSLVLRCQMTSILPPSFSGPPQLQFERSFNVKRWVEEIGVGVNASTFTSRLLHDMCLHRARSAAYTTRIVLSITSF